MCLLCVPDIVLRCPWPSILELQSCQMQTGMKELQKCSQGRRSVKEMLRGLCLD